jgi:hypothetical protein
MSQRVLLGDVPLQPICLMEFFSNSSSPAEPYGFVDNNYQGQHGPKLAKYFKASPWAS